MNKEGIKTETITEKESTMNSEYFVTHDEIVGYDFQGWPLYQLRVISLLRAMGMSDDIID